MATTSTKSGTATRKSSSKPASTSTRTREDTTTPDAVDTAPDAAADQPADQPAADATTADTVDAPDTTDQDTTGQPSADDPAAALKQRIRTTQHVSDARPDELTDEQRMNLVGAPGSAVGGPRTLATASASTRRGEEYVTAETDGYVAWVPKHTSQPATVRVWVKDQRVRKDMHDALAGLVAPTAQAARVLSGDEYAQAAPYL